MDEYICPECKRPIYDEDALLCHFCGASLKRAGRGLISGIRYSNRQALWFMIVFGVLLAFILLFLR